MNKIDYYLDGNVMHCHDAAIVLGDDDPRVILCETAIQTLATDVWITVGGVRMFLAAWQDPDHWEEDWRAAGVNDVDAFVAEHLNRDDS